MNENNTLTQDFIKIGIGEVNDWLYKIVKRTASIMLINSPNLETTEDIDTLIESYKNDIVANETKLAEVMALKEDEEKSNQVAKEEKEEALKNLNAYKESKKELIEDFTAKVEHLKKLQENASDFLNTFLEPILIDLEDIITNNDDVEITENKIKEIEETTVEQSFEDTKGIIELNIQILNERIKQAEKVKQELLNTQEYLGISTAVEANPIIEN